MRSKGAIRSFWVFLALSLVVDWIWFVYSSGMRPFNWERLEQLNRQARASEGDDEAMGTYGRVPMQHVRARLPARDKLRSR